MTGDAGTEPVSGDVTGVASTEPGVGDVTVDTSTQPGVGDGPVVRIRAWCLELEARLAV